jgi:hypothetical protein
VEPREREPQRTLPREGQLLEGHPGPSKTHTLEIHKGLTMSVSMPWLSELLLE